MDAKAVNPIDQDLDRLEQELAVKVSRLFHGELSPALRTKAARTAIKRVYDNSRVVFCHDSDTQSGCPLIRHCASYGRRQLKRDGRAAGPTSNLIPRFASTNGDPLLRPRFNAGKLANLYDHLIGGKSAIR